MLQVLDRHKRWAYCRTVLKCSLGIETPQHACRIVPDSRYTLSCNSTPSFTRIPYWYNVIYWTAWRNVKFTRDCAFTYVNCYPRILPSSGDVSVWRLRLPQVTSILLLQNILYDTKNATNINESHNEPVWDFFPHDDIPGWNICEHSEELRRIFTDAGLHDPACLDEINKAMNIIDDFVSEHDIQMHKHSDA